jgi:hypothetical protein
MAPAPPDDPDEQRINTDVDDTDEGREQIDIGDLREVYRSVHVLEADRAIVEVLEPEGIPAFRRDRGSHALPAPDTSSGSYFIAVPEGQAAEARRLLAQALTDGVLDADSGEVVGSPIP